MSEVTGVTANGFAYTAEYMTAARDSVCWAATFRMQGIYRGMRHGRVFDVSTMTIPELDVAVMDDIDVTWCGEH